MSTVYIIVFAGMLLVSVAIVQGMSLLIERFVLSPRISRPIPRRLLAALGAWLCAALIMFAIYLTTTTPTGPDRLQPFANLAYLAAASVFIPAPATIIVALVGVLRAWRQSRRTTLSSGTIEETFG